MNKNMNTILALISLSISLSVIISIYNRNLDDDDKISDRIERWFETASFKKKLGLTIIFFGLPCIIIFPAASGLTDSILEEPLNNLEQKIEEQDETQEKTDGLSDKLNESVDKNK